MASTGDIHEDVSPRPLPTLVKASDRHPDKKDFDIRLSRMSITNSEEKESMLAYSEHVRQLSHTRKIRPTHVSQLALRAHHVPKNTSSMTLRHRRKAMSLNELSDKRKNPINDRRHSVSSVRALPSLKVTHLPPKHLRISFVSASDLHDIIDYSLKSKGTYNEGLRLSLWENSAPLSWMPEKHKSERTVRTAHTANETLTTPLSGADSEHQSPEKKFKSDFPLFKQDMNCRSHVPSDLPRGNVSSSVPDLPPLQQIFPHQQTDKSTVRISRLLTGNALTKPGVLRHRPRRAKRMILHKPELGVIPEGEGDGDLGGRTKQHVPSMSSLEAIKGSRSHFDKKHLDLPLQEISLESLLGVSDLNKPRTDSDIRTPSSTVSTETRSKHQLISVVSGPKDKGTQQNNGSAPLNITPDSFIPEKEPRTTVTDVGKGLTVSNSNKSKAIKRMNKLIFLRDYPERYYHRK